MYEMCYINKHALPIVLFQSIGNHVSCFWPWAMMIVHLAAHYQMSATWIKC